MLCYRYAPCLAQLDVSGNRYCGPDLNQVQDVVKVRWDLNTDDPSDVGVP